MNRLPQFGDVIRIGTKELLVIEHTAKPMSSKSAFSVTPFLDTPTGEGIIAISPNNTYVYDVDVAAGEVVHASGAKVTRTSLRDVVLVGNATCAPMIKVVKYKSV